MTLNILNFVQQLCDRSQQREITAAKIRAILGDDLEAFREDVREICSRYPLSFRKVWPVAVGMRTLNPDRQQVLELLEQAMVYHLGFYWVPLVIFANCLATGNEDRLKRLMETNP